MLISEMVDERYQKEVHWVLKSNLFTYVVEKHVVECPRATRVLTALKEEEDISSLPNTQPPTTTVKGHVQGNVKLEDQADEGNIVGRQGTMKTEPFVQGGNIDLSR